MHWNEFIYEGQIYNLEHLNPFTVQWTRPAKGDRASVTFWVDVSFSFHCFTKSISAEGFDARLKYSDARETRVFDFERYELSKLLPGIVRSLAERKCLHAGRGNFVTVNLVSADGTTKKYHVFFEPSKASARGRLNLYIQSAYVPVRDVARGRMPMNFLYILHNTLHGIPFRS